jgi:hypothetical protein
MLQMTRTMPADELVSPLAPPDIAVGGPYGTARLAIAAAVVAETNIRCFLPESGV